MLPSHVSIYPSTKNVSECLFIYLNFLSAVLGTRYVCVCACVCVCRFLSHSLCLSANFFYYIKLWHSCAVCLFLLCSFSIGAIENGWNPRLYYDWCMTFTICTKCLYTLNAQAHNFLWWHISLSIMVIIIVNVVAFLLPSLMSRVPHKRPYSENSGKNNPEHSQTHEHQGTKHKKTKRDRENNNNRKNDTIENCPRAIYLYYSSSTYFPSNFPLPCVSLWANVCFPFCHLFFLLVARDLLNSRY